MKTNQHTKFGLILVLLLTTLSSCVDLKSVNNYSSSSSTAIKKFEDIDYSFNQHCNVECLFSKIKHFEIDSAPSCNCQVYQQADSVTMVIYSAIKTYFDGLASLSNDGLTDYNFDPLGKALKEGSFGKITINKNDVDAYSAIVKTLSKVATDIYRKKKIKNYITEANDPLQKLIKKFSYILQDKLVKELTVKKAKLFTYYNDMKMNNTLTDYEKGKATIDYYQQLSDITLKQNQIKTFAKGLKSIADGHQKLYDNRNKISSAEVKSMLIGYAGNIQDIISEFNKLNNK